MIPDPNDTYVDFFNQPITLNSKLLVPVNGRMKLCAVTKLNRKSLVVRELEFKNGGPIRTRPYDTVVLNGEDLTALALRKGLQL